jgi:hypothetical protein
MIALHMSDPAQRAIAEELDRQEAEFYNTPQQLYARVRPGSKYAHQNEWAESNPARWGWPFRVVIVSGCDYAVQGGPGGQYRLQDVDLFVIEDGVEVKISG